MADGWVGGAVLFGAGGTAQNRRNLCLQLQDAASPVCGGGDGRDRHIRQRFTSGDGDGCDRPCRHCPSRTRRLSRKRRGLERCFTPAL